MNIPEIKSKLKEISASTGRNYNDLVLELAMESLVVRLIKNKYLNENLVFKGGFVVYKAMNSQRFTRDVDSLCFNPDIAQLKNNFQDALTKEINDGFIFYDFCYEDLLHIEDYNGLRCSVRFTLANDVKKVTRGQKLHLDIGFGDYLASKAVVTNYKYMLTNASQVWKIYPLESIISEKIEALVKRGDLSSRGKDIYDLSLLLPKIKDLSLLKKAIIGTFTRRHTELPKNFYNYISAIDTKILKTSWGAIDLIGEDADFDKTWLMFLNELKKLGI